MKLSIAGLLLLVSLAAAAASEATPGGSLMLAAILAEHAPWIGRSDKALIASLARGDLTSHRKGPLTVAADAVECRSSNVDITQRSCAVRLGGKTAVVKGRDAHELFATLAELGVHSSGAAGSVYIGVSEVKCRIDPAVLRDKAGGGAACQFAPAD